VPPFSTTEFAGQALDVLFVSTEERPADADHSYPLDNGRTYYATEAVHGLLCGKDCWTKGESRRPRTPRPPAAAVAVTHVAPAEPMPMMAVSWSAAKVHVSADGMETICGSLVPVDADRTVSRLDWYKHATCYNCLYRLWPNHAPAGYLCQHCHPGNTSPTDRFTDSHRAASGYSRPAPSRRGATHPVGRPRGRR
jgi:hypothetical protein